MTGFTVENWLSYPGLVMLGFAVLIAVRLLYGHRGKEPEDVLYLTMNVVGRTMIASGFIGACLVFMSLLGILYGGAVLVVLAVAAVRYRTCQRAALLSVLAAATQRWMPLAPAVAAVGAEWRGAFGRRARQLGHYLASGVPLSEALRASGLATPLTLAAVEVGCRCGVLGAAMTEAVRLQKPSQPLVRLWELAAYLTGMLFVAQSILTFVMYRTVPELIKIFADFDAELPRPTVVLVDVGNYFVNNWPLGVLANLLLPAIILIMAARYLGWIDWDLPLVSRWTRRWHSATVLRLLALVAEAGRPIETGMAAVVESYPSTFVRRRLAYVLADVQLGVDWCDSLQRHGLLRGNDAALLESAARAGNLGWAMRETAAAAERKCSYRLQAGLEILLPAIVFALGAGVAFVVLSLFLPLIALIENLL